MSTRAHAVNPDVLKWARETAGLTLEAAAKTVAKDASALGAWESGQEAPTYRQLQALADRAYKRPVAIFFFSQVPDEEPLGTEFRTLPPTEIAALHSDTRYALREARARQLIIAKLAAGLESDRRVITEDIHASPDDSVSLLAKEVRSYLGISVEEQKGWADAEWAFKQWRTSLEKVGVFVFKRVFKQNGVSGFCLDGSEYPLIVVNNQNSFTRQTFTLFHELAHLLFGFSGVTTVEQSYLSSLRPELRRVEVSCNQFASEFLVPAETFPWADVDGREDSLLIASLAKDYNVSRHVILRRLLDAGRISKVFYEKKVSEWEGEFFRDDESSSGGLYYNNQGAYLSETFAALAFRQYHAGRIGLADVADYFGMKAKSVEVFEDYLLRRKPA